MGKIANTAEGIITALVRSLKHFHIFIWLSSFWKSPVWLFHRLANFGNIWFSLLRTGCVATQIGKQWYTHSHMAGLLHFKRRWIRTLLKISTCTKPIYILMMKSYKLVLNNNEILNILFFQILIKMNWQNLEKFDYCYWELAALQHKLLMSEVRIHRWQHL